MNNRVISNKAAYHHYHIEDTYVAGMVLAGTEIKSIREGKVSFNDSFCIVHNGEVWLKNMHIAEYAFGTTNNHMTVRDRKLLLNKKEIRKIAAALKNQGYTLIPLKLFINEKGLAKLEIGLGRGKKLYDKRETIKKREANRNTRRNL